MKTEDLKSYKVIEMAQSEMKEITGGNIFKNAWGWIKDHVTFKIEGGATIHT